MLKHARLALPAIALCVLSLSLSIFSPQRAARADTCLSGPGKTAPQGSHWFYRIERPSLRKCWHLAKKDQSQQASAAKSAVEPDADDIEDVAPAIPIAAAPANRLAARADASGTPPPAPAMLAPVIRNLVTRNVSNGPSEAASALPPERSTDTATRADNAEAAQAEPAAAQETSPAPIIPLPALQEPASTPVAEKNDKPAASAASNVPTLGTLLGALALLGILTSAVLFALQMRWRRSDVLNGDWNINEASSDAGPQAPRTEAAPSFAPLPPMGPLAAEDDIDQALRRFARSIHRRAA